MTGESPFPDHNECMRTLVFLILAAAAMALPAGAGNLDPGKLVLRPADVPSGFTIDRDGTGVRSNAKEAKSEPRLEPLLRRWKRLTGYEAEFVRGKVRIESRIDIFVGREGAKELVAWIDREIRKLGLSGLSRRRAGMGDQGWVYRARYPVPATIVLWRYGRVSAGVAGTLLPQNTTLALARVQQRRIATAVG